MGRVVAALSDAVPHADNPAQASMLQKYAESFTLGSIDAHKEGSRHWIQVLLTPTPPHHHPITTP